MPEHTMAIHIPQPLYERLQRLATVTHRPLEQLVLQAVEAHVPPLLEDMPAAMQEDLSALETLDVPALWQVAQAGWDAEQHQQYTALLAQERAGTLTPAERTTLEMLYEDANRHMLRKAYANALLQWYGYTLPPLPAYQSIS